MLTRAHLEVLYLILGQSLLEVGTAFGSRHPQPHGSHLLAGAWCQFQTASTPHGAVFYIVQASAC